MGESLLEAVDNQKSSNELNNYSLLKKLPSDMKLSEALLIVENTPVLDGSSLTIVDNKLCMVKSYAQLADIEQDISTDKQFVLSKSKEGSWSVTYMLDLPKTTIKNAPLEESKTELEPESHAIKSSTNEPPVSVELLSDIIAPDSSSESKQKETKLGIPPSELSSSNIYMFADTNNRKKKYLKVPIAKVGQWEHPDYGTIAHTENTLDELEKNFKNNILGYQPPLWLGHPEDRGSALKHGSLEKVEREGDLLYGVFSANPDIYRYVEEDKVQLSSAEIATNYKDKTTGSEIGSVLVGMALLNTPFIPDQPNVVALSDGEQKGEYSCFKLDIVKPDINVELSDNIEETPSNNNTDDSNNMPNVIDKTESPVQEKDTNAEVEDTNTEVKDTNAEVKDTNTEAVDYKAQLELLKATLTKQIEDVVQQNKILSQKIAQQEEEKKNRIIEKKLEELATYNLPTEMKNQYSELIKSGKLGESEDTVLNSIRKLGDVYHSNAFGQIGSAHSQMNLEDSAAKESNQYSDLIERNKKIAQDMKESTKLY
jgi:hypothetical protein